MSSRVPGRALLVAGALATTAVLAIAACSGDGTSTTDSASSAPPTTADVTTATTSPDESTSTTQSTTTTSTTTTTTSTTTTTTLPLVTEGGIVKVANASNFGGAAGLLTSALAQRGFSVSDPTDAAGWEEILELTKIYSREESRPVAESVSRLLGGVPIERMPTPVPIRDAMEGLGDANVLVMLGRDLAGKPLPDTAP